MNYTRDTFHTVFFVLSPGFKTCLCIPLLFLKVIFNLLWAVIWPLETVDTLLFPKLLGSIEQVNRKTLGLIVEQINISLWGHYVRLFSSTSLPLVAFQDGRLSPAFSSASLESPCSMLLLEWPPWAELHTWNLASAIPRWMSLNCNIFPWETLLLPCGKTIK